MDVAVFQPPLCSSTRAAHHELLDETACMSDAKWQKEFFHDQRGT